MKEKKKDRTFVSFGIKKLPDYFYGAVVYLNHATRPSSFKITYCLFQSLDKM